MATKTTTAQKSAETLPVAQADIAQGLLARKGTTLAEIMRALQAAEAQAAGSEPKPSELIGPLPSAVELTEEEVTALRTLPRLLSTVELPDKRRVLSLVEIERLDDLLIAVKTLKALVSRLEDKTIKPAFFNHFDQMALREGRVTAETMRTKEGWFCLPDKENGGTLVTPNKATREISGGGTTLTAEALEGLMNSGELSREDYLKLTRPKRVVEEVHFMSAFADLVKRKPRIASIIAKATSIGRPSTAMYNRKNR
jgi:hypothetical protein